MEIGSAARAERVDSASEQDSSTNPSYFFSHLTLPVKIACMFDDRVRENNVWRAAQHPFHKKSDPFGLGQILQRRRA